ncbi:hypothetical protein [Nocardia terpenica]|uniref:hypothetical protein n=1 Tax=Nocardia terpenica TaxID=455432 RepID=UPI000ABC2DD8|nr:hypothetical protein [Nocardia terpenica]NQE91172.1 hypothetical protein [Nocardia terpenica]
MVNTGDADVVRYLPGSSTTWPGFVSLGLPTGRVCGGAAPFDVAYTHPFLTCTSLQCCDGFGSVAAFFHFSAILWEVIACASLGCGPDLVVRGLPRFDDRW